MKWSAITSAGSSSALPIAIRCAGARTSCRAIITSRRKPGARAIPEELYPTAYVAERTIKYLENYSRSDRAKPFFLQCSFPDPHHPFTPPGRYWDMYDPSSDLFAAVVQSRRATHPAAPAAALRRAAPRKSNRDGQRTFAVTEREAREATALTYGMITMIDDAIGSILGWLKTLRLDEDTVVIFTSDHGDFMGDHQLLAQRRAALPRPGARAVYLERSADRSAGLVNAGLCGTLDIARTILAPRRTAGPQRHAGAKFHAGRRRRQDRPRCRAHRRTPAPRLYGIAE